ncbi:hypothetical protein WH52_02280 [Tenacibaculum holothuriorum]|uniref:TonB-dependent receptor plug domain-containing protein n=1 Tax=Tenacibaculum holothuriorum TaxID=1635173 RepID=A0A1Y2PG70_9FLAO|nr:TonB-dependent receptor plug domain-containing protein [Tenacibaculum holothuriorum]OSY89482.1 hypothetical protein WH52_02280 [Tenacibaculum holothuriorum]
MKKQLLIVGALALSLASTKTFAQEQEKTEKLDEVVVTATKFKLKKEHTGKVIYEITKEDIKNNAGRTVVELLNNLPGVEINAANATRGRVRGVYVRGGRSRQNLILIDGIPVSDASGINQTYDLRLLSLTQIEKIEVLKGAASSLYGTGAATGVINIILNKSSKKEISAVYEASLGTNNSSASKSLRPNDKNQNVSINGTLGKVNYLAYFNLTGSEGLSAARSKNGANFEDDSFYGRNGLVKLGYQINDAIKVDAFLNYDAFDSEFDAGAYRDNSDNNWKYSQVRYGIKPSYKYNKGEVYALASFNEIKRDLTQFNSFANRIDNSVYEGTAINIDLVNKYSVLDEQLQIIAGLNYQKHTNNTQTPFGAIDKDFNTIDPYVSLVYISDFGLNVNAGSRLNIHSVYGNHFVYDANVSYNVFKDRNYKLKLMSSYGTSFIAPSLYQLYSSGGNLDLNPEDSKTFEIGFDAEYNKIVNFTAVYFNRKENNAIEYDYTTFKYYNANKTANGIETNLTLNPIKKLKVLANYTYTDVVSTEHFDDYIPTHKIVTSIESTHVKNLFMSLVYKNVGERVLYDRYGGFGVAGENVILPNYSLVDFNANYKVLNDKVTFFGAVSNILNEDYEETLGFSSRGRNYKLGVRLQF